MFRGVNTVTIDAKGRVALPPKYRADLQKLKVVVTIDTEDQCLLLYPLNEWLLIEEKVESLPSFNEVTRRIKRLLIGHAHELDIDSQGRVLLPKTLRKYAKLNKKTVFVGQGKKFEIWSEAVWQNSCEDWLNSGAIVTDQLPEELKGLVV
jgi:MraZ protein